MGELLPTEENEVVHFFIWEEDIKTEAIKPIVLNSLKLLENNNRSDMKKIRKETDEGLKFISNQITVSETFSERFCQIRFLRDFKNCLRTQGVSEENVEHILKTQRFVSFEISIGDYEVIASRNILNDLVNISVVTDDVTVKTSLNINNTSRFEKISFFSLQLGSAPNWNSMSNQVYINGSVPRITPIDKNNLSCDCKTGKINE